MSQTFTVIESSSQAVTPGVNSSDFTNDFSQGLTFTLTTGAAVGNAKASFKVQRKDEVGGQYLDIPGALSAQIGPASSTDISIHPGILAANNRRVSDVAPKVFRVVLIVAGGTSIVAGIGGEFN